MIRFAYLAVFILLWTPSDAAETRRNGVCPWAAKRSNRSCGMEEFECLNRRCIKKTYYCDGDNDCGDFSDERYCSTTGPCPKDLPFWKCEISKRCIPGEWVRDGNKDCPRGEDEEYSGVIHVLSGPKDTYKGKEFPTEAWGLLVEKLAVAYHLGSIATKESRREMAYEVSIRLLSQLSRCPLTDIPSMELASYINALVVSCLDPRKFHGRDIVQELRSRQRQANPYVFLALCNAGESITESDRDSLVKIFRSKKRAFWTDIQAYAVMALACASRQPGSEVDSKTMRELTMELKHHQNSNGSLEDLQTTALVLQALFAAEPDDDTRHFDEAAAMDHIRSIQNSDGSFDSPMLAYYFLPVLNCRSLADIGTDHCPHLNNKNESEALDELTKDCGPTVRIQYSLWIGDRREMEWNIAMRVPENSSFYWVMEKAAEMDPRYRFEYITNNRKPYITAVHGMREDVEMGKLWVLYRVKDGMPSPVTASPADLVPENGEHLAMWYRSGSWTE